MLLTMQLNTYKSFGLYIASEIDLPELPAYQAESTLADVFVYRANLTEKWVKHGGASGKFYVNSDQVWFHIANVATFCIQHGKEILVSPMKNADENQIRLFILGTCMGAILMQKQIMPLHGSALTYEKKVYAIIGESGAGKSTLAHALLQQGFQLLSDDLIAVTFDDSLTPIVHPAYPQQKLWKESLQQFGQKTDRYTPLFEREDKYQVPVSSSYCAHSFPLAGIYELKKHENEDETDIVLHTPNKLECLQTIYRHTFRRTLISRLGLLQWHFNCSAALANYTYLKNISRPLLRFTAHELAQVIIKDVEKEGVKNDNE